MAEFSSQVYQNEYLPDGGNEVHAVVAVTCSGAGAAGASGEAGEILIIDTSGSMNEPNSKIRAARQAAEVALGEIADGTWFAVISGSEVAKLAYPNSGESLMVKMDAKRRGDAIAAVRRLAAAGGTAIGSWLNLASQAFTAQHLDQAHAILLTDGRNQSEERRQLEQAVEHAQGKFQCDARGVGADWVVEELRYVASELLGTVDLIADPAKMEADFEALMKNAMSRGVSRAALRVWSPQGAEVLFVRQVAPSIEDLTVKKKMIAPLIAEFPTGAWGDETREYHVAVRVAPRGIGAEQLAARVQLAIGDDIQTQGLVRAVWSDDATLTTRINPAVAHYTGQTELAGAIQEGLAARAAGDEATATVKLGRAVQLAAATGNDEATSKLAKVVDVEDAGTGTVRLKRGIDKLDEMALDTASTKTTRVR